MSISQSTCNSLLQCKQTGSAVQFLDEYRSQADKLFSLFVLLRKNPSSKVPENTQVIPGKYFTLPLPILGPIVIYLYLTQVKFWTTCPSLVGMDHYGQ